MGDKGGLPCDPEYLEMFKKHYDLRAGLKAYLYSAFETQSRTGLPLARPLVMDAPGDRQTWTIDDQFMIGDALMFPPAGMSGPESTNRTVYFPKTAKSWHSWFHNATSYQPGQSVVIDTPIMTAPLFVKGGVPVVYKQHPEVENTVELMVWMPHTPATDCMVDQWDAAQELAWSGIYDDQGETTRYKTHGEHWRAHAGFGATHCSAGTSTGGHLSLHFEVSHRSYAVPYERVEWTVRELSDAVAGVDCVTGDNVVASESEVMWSHSAALEELRVAAPLGHRCTVHLATAVTPAAPTFAAVEWKNVTVYRVTPMADTGVLNMNTADGMYRSNTHHNLISRDISDRLLVVVLAAGDIYFGVSQLLLPYMCDGSSSVGIWCNNRKWLSGGNAWMVYRSFIIEARTPFGSYSPCNPDPKTGVFSCGMHGGSGNQTLPKTCEKYHEHHSHFMNGATYRTVDSIGEACDGCTKDGKGCNSWRQLSPASFGLMENGTEADQVQGAFVVSGEKMGPHGDERCWNDDPSSSNVSFAPFCDRKNCTCAAYDKLSLGVESHAMCWDNGGGHGSPPPPPPPPGHVDYRSWMSGLACLMDGNWYSTQAAGQCKTTVRATIVAFILKPP